MAGERILIVEDNEKNMKLACDLLEPSRLRDGCGTDGRGRRWRRPLRCPPDLILMDIALPGIGRDRGARAPQGRPRHGDDPGRAR